NLEEVADEPEVPSFVKGNPSQPWGSLYEIRPYAQGTEPAVETGQQTLWGWESLSPGPQQPDGSTESRSSPSEAGTATTEATAAAPVPSLRSGPVPGTGSHPGAAEPVRRTNHRTNHR